MSVVAGHDLTQTRFCRKDSCPNEVRPGGATEPGRQGRYGNLCQEHYDAERQRASSEQGAEPRRPNRSPQVAAGTLVARVNRLKALAADVDKAEAKARKLTEQALAAKELRDRKEEEFQALARELMGDSVAA